MQLDLFQHSRDVVLRNEAIDAARSHSASALSAAMAALAHECASDPLLPPLDSLLRRLRVAMAPAPTRAQALELLQLTQDCVPAAEQVFGNGAAAWLAPLWARLAAGIGGFAFDPGCERLHAAPLLLRAGKCSEASASVEAIASWRRQPAPLAWQAEAQFHLAGLSAAWPLLSELAWMAAARAAALAAALRSAELDALLRQFHTEFEGEGEAADFAWFPAWAVIVEPQRAAATRLAQAGANTAPERAARQVLNLFTLERQGLHAKLLEARATLRALHAQLFELYMRTR